MFFLRVVSKRSHKPMPKIPGKQCLLTRPTSKRIKKTGKISRAEWFYPRGGVRRARHRAQATERMRLRIGMAVPGRIDDGELCWRDYPPHPAFGHLPPPGEGGGGGVRGQSGVQMQVFDKAIWQFLATWGQVRRVVRGETGNFR